jgi:hypothetical protein
MHDLNNAAGTRRNLQVASLNEDGRSSTLCFKMNDQFYTFKQTIAES